MNRKQILSLSAIALALSLAGCQADRYGDLADENDPYELVSEPDTATHEQDPYDLVAEPSTSEDDGGHSSNGYTYSSSLGKSSSSIASSSSAAASANGVVHCYVSSIDRCLSSDEEGNEALTETYCALVSGTVVSSCDGYQ